MSEETGKFSLPQWGESMELSEDTIKTLDKEGFTSVRALKTLHGDSDSLNLWNLPLAQRDQPQPSGAVDQSHPMTPVTTKTLAADHDLNVMLQSLKDAHLKDLLDLEADDTQGAALGQWLNQTKKAKKPLLIPDHIVNPRETDHDDDKELFAGSGYRVCLKASKVKPKPENVTIPQWLSTMDSM